VLPKVAVTELGAFKVTLQVVFPVHAPPQPPKPLFVPDVSLKVICVLWGKLAEHVVGQLMPAGLLVTVPVPAPSKLTVKSGLKLAETLAGVVTRRLQVLLPEQLPLQPAKE
jgi:hypothetical protein